MRETFDVREHNPPSPASHKREPWRRRLVPAPLARERLAGQAVRFGMVGLSNTVVDFAVLNLLLWLAGLPLLAANTLAYSAGILNSFVWNKHWTFSAGGSGAVSRELTAFLLVSFTALVVNDLGILGLNSIFGGESVLALNLQKAGASVLSMTWNFLGYRFLAFPTGSRREGG